MIARVLRQPVKILFVAANTASGGQLEIGVEHREIQKRLRSAADRGALHLIGVFAAELSDLQQALIQHRPDIVHFACHGSQQAELMLADEAGTARVPAAALAAMFRVLRDNVRLVVFNACFASKQAEQIRQSVGLAIGMRAQVEDRAAIRFAPSLYGALAEGCSVGDAFALGAAEIATVDPLQRDLAQIFAADGVDANATYLSGRWRIFPIAATAAVAICAVLGLGWWLRRPSEPPPLPPPSPGMVRFLGGAVRPGVFATARRPPECASLTAEEDCAAPDHPDRIAAIPVEPFDLDALEVTNHDYAAWLNTHVEAWQRATEGVLATRQMPPVPLVRLTPECGGGLLLAEGAHVLAAIDKAHRPVVCVTWYGGSAYCRAQGKRLPLEIEWELAAKGPEGRPFPWGDSMPKQDGVAFDRRASGASQPSDVGTSRQDVSPEGVHDLGGNVAEWVDGSRDADGAMTFRGGSWASIGACRLLGSGCKHRPAVIYASDVGFRCASSVLAESPRGRTGP